MLFKGRFQIDIISTAQKLFSNPETSLKEKLKISVDKEGNVEIDKFIKNNYFSFGLYRDYETYDFKFHQPLDVHPPTMDVRDKDFTVSFRVLSEPIEISTIKGRDITFSNKKFGKQTTSLPNNIEIVNI